MTQMLTFGNVQVKSFESTVYYFVDVTAKKSSILFSLLHLAFCFGSSPVNYVLGIFVLCIPVPVTKGNIAFKFLSPQLLRVPVGLQHSGLTYCILHL